MDEVRDGERGRTGLPGPALSDADLGDVPAPVLDAYRALRADWLRLRQLGWDAEGLLPLLSSTLASVGASLGRGQALGVLLLGVENLAEVEETFGWEAADELLAAVADIAREFLEEGAPEGSVLAREGPFGEEVVLLVPFPGGDTPSVDELSALATALRRAVEQGVPAESLRGIPRIASGQAVLFRSPARRFERSVVRAVHAARTMMRGEDAHARLSRKLHLADIIDRAHLSVAYQPIVDLTSRSIAGYEALCRGPQGTPFEVADFLFSSSHELELAHELDEACRRLILSRRPDWPSSRLLFVNVLPDAIATGLTQPDALVELLRGSGISPRQVVLEMLERGRVNDWKAFRKRLAAFREAGFQLACDDVGTGVSSLRLVPEVEPDFLKVDLSLVRGIHESRAQQGVVVTLVELAARVGAEVICEGIEQPEELDVIESLGVRYGQGFLLARPAASPALELPLR